MPGVHLHRVHVGFGDCDPAGIVYFPRFFGWFHEAMESWFAAIGHPYRVVIQERRLGFPAVHTEADFRAASHFGETIDVELVVTKVGRSSLEFGYRVCKGEEVRVVGKTVCAVMDLDPTHVSHRRAVPLPSDLLEAIARFRA